MVGVATRLAAVAFPESQSANTCSEESLTDETCSPQARRRCDGSRSTISWRRSGLFKCPVEFKSFIVETMLFTIEANSIRLSRSSFTAFSCLVWAINVRMTSSGRPNRISSVFITSGTLSGTVSRACTASFALPRRLFCKRARFSGFEY